ncbi:MAG TPA: hypothetical protein VH591_19035 [Ktedonobacterales bacterium]|jgi:hypothetical protein
MDDDKIPEERQEHYTQLIALLRRGLREPTDASSVQHSQIIARVHERLMRGDDVLSAQAEELPVHRLRLQTSPRTIPSTPARRGRLTHIARDLAAVLVIGILVGATVLMFRSAIRPTGVQPPVASTGPTVVSQVDGLRASIHVVTSGPYFLRELVSVDVSLTNQTSRSVEFDGSSKPDIACYSSALSVQITAGSAPTFELPRLSIPCAQPLYMTTVAPGQTLTFHYFLPVTRSGEVTITMGGMPDSHQASPLDGHWPSVSIDVDPQVPANRVILLRSQGAQVIVQAPPEAQAHLLYWESITCDKYEGGGSRLDWSPLPTLVLSQPACPTAHRHWAYIVSAPGYATVAGTQDS